MSDKRTLIQQACESFLDSKGLLDDKHKKRLLMELDELDCQDEHDYFYDLWQAKTRFAENEHNLLIAYALGLVDHFDISKEFAFTMGEFPDIDTDYLPKIQTHLKEKWAVDTFGRENICSISTYGTLGIKNSLLDMSRVHAIPLEEIQPVTKQIKAKDDEGKEVTWDKALELYEDMAAFCKRHPEVAAAAKMLLDRNKNHGVHAGGLIISSKPIADFVPLEVRSAEKKGGSKEGVIVSAWTEGQASQDLQPVGLIKFDILVVDGLMQIAIASELIKQRHGLKNICALPDRRDWTDTAYLNDPLSIQMANKADLKCIFQFTSDGMRKLVKQGGVSAFDDLPVYSSLYRPSCIQMGMHETYVKRKKGEEPFDLHPLLKPVLGKTFNVMAYQEQIMAILNIVGGIPLTHCEKVRKAISKKKLAGFAKYKDMFIENGMKNLNQSREYLIHLWEQVEAFSGYGFNKAHAYEYAYISARQLWLKAHYPLEFYAAMLMCEEDHAKIKEIKIDAHQHGVELMPIHINKSKMNFEIHEDKIYMGFGNIKGIGKEVASKIVAGQPYTSFLDFLQRFGTDKVVLDSLISLGVFEEQYDKQTMYQFYEYYKDSRKKRVGSENRFQKSLVKYDNDIAEVTLDHWDKVKSRYATYEEFVSKCGKFDEACYAEWETLKDIPIEEPYTYKGEQRTRTITLHKVFNDIRRKRESSISNQAAKEKEAEEKVFSLDGWKPVDKWTVKERTEGDEPVEEKPPSKAALARLKAHDELMKILLDQKQAESEYYGFQWTHDLEESPDYDGFTLDKFIEDTETEDLLVGCVEFMVRNVQHITSKKGTLYHSVEAEDANGKVFKITFWDEDYQRFAEELVPKQLIRARLKPPSGGFPAFGFDSPPKHERWKVPQQKNDDFRLIVMRRKLS